ncbi:MAG TPA: rhomboid family intramembrane serine protease [Chloroflexota bacterium]|nr:rhomboid family intramembrane serine protease [Chloroflexota bacterium]
MIPIKDYAGPRRSFPWVMLAIVILNVLVFVFELGFSESSDLDVLFSSAGVIPVEFTQGRNVGAPPPLGVVWTTLFTSMFLHGGFLHIASNMLYLFIFGDNVEDQLGHLRFLVFYFLAGVVAGLTHIVVNAPSAIPSVGASGAIAGVLAAYLRMFPSASVRTLLVIGPFITVPRISAALLIGFWFVTQFLTGIASLGATSEQTSGGVAVWAHIGGFVAGLVLVQFMRPTPRVSPLPLGEG